MTTFKMYVRVFCVDEYECSYIVINSVNFVISYMSLRSSISTLALIQ